MKRGFLIIAIITIAVVVGLVTVRYSPWLSTTLVNNYSQGCDPSSEVPYGSSSEGPEDAWSTNCQRSFFPPPSPVVLRYACNDGVDNDRDGSVDAADAGCHKNHDRLDEYLPHHTGESGEGECADGKDNDGDGHADALDPGCYNLEGAVSLAKAMQERNRYEPDAAEAREPGCADKKDNDGDGDIDSSDGECDDPVTGQYDFQRDEAGVSCSDGKDNDNDSYADKDDPGCHEKFDFNQAYLPHFTDESKGAVCADGKDNEKILNRATNQLAGDGTIDRRDLGCYDLAQIRVAIAAGQEVGSSHEFYVAVTDHSEWYRSNRDTEYGEPGCANSLDDDNDGTIDENDTGCINSETAVYDPFESETLQESPCGDREDNDGDGTIDAGDPECIDPTTKVYDASRSESTGPACSDGIDNDGDGRKDREDPGCRLGNNPSWRYSARDNNEAGERQCVDGQDNDNDGRVDGADPNCYLGGRIRSSTRWLWLDNKEAP